RTERLRGRAEARWHGEKRSHPTMSGAMSQYFTDIGYFVLLPAILLAMFGCATLLFDVLFFRNSKDRKYLLLLVVIPGLIMTGVSLWRLQTSLSASGSAPLIAFQGALTIDRFALF